MVQPYCNYFKLGINHHLLYPEVTDDPDYHEETLGRLVEMEPFEVLDLYIPRAPEVRSREIELLRASGKEVVYNPPGYWAIPGLNPNSADPQVQRRTLERAVNHLEAAYQVGAHIANIASGLDTAPEQRPAAKDGFVSFLCKLSAEAAARDILLVIEPFDRSIGKNLLIGPTAEAVEVVERVRQQGFSNMGLMLDMGHLPLLDEQMRQAFEISAPYLWHTHVGNCLKSDPDSEFYGDKHPPLGLPGGEHDWLDVVEFFRAAFDVGYLAPGKRATVTLEMQPHPGLSAEESVPIWLKKLEEVWTFYWESAQQAPQPA